jgi:methylmalonyl-CoA/ethylmalonyl-CoA epimerase
MRFHHVGYAVNDIDTYVAEFFQPMFDPVSISEKTSDPEQEVTVCFARMQGGAIIELVEPAREASRLNSVIGSARGGIYHLCYETSDLEQRMARFRAMKCLILGKPVAAAAFNGRRIVFLLTPQKDLVELLEAE